MTDALVPVAPAQVQLGTLRAATPDALVASATEMANALAGVIEKQKLYNMLQGKRYVRCEGWTTLAAMMGVTPHEVDVTEKDGAYTATVELRRMADNQPIARASAECGGRHEGLWNGRPPYARRSMALTRATSKAARLAFSWVMTLAGYEATPAEEMDGVVDEKPAPRQAPAAPPAPPESVAELARNFVKKMADKPKPVIEGEQVMTTTIDDTKMQTYVLKKDNERSGKRKGETDRFFIIKTTSGTEFTTDDEKLFSAASALIGNGPAVVKYKTYKKGNGETGYNLRELTPEEPPAEPDQETIPF
jgi:hypothetical protein